MIVSRPVRRIPSRAPLFTPSPAMNSRHSLLAAVIVSLLLSTPASAVTEQIFEEGFSDFNLVWNSTSGKIGTSSPELFNADSNGWTGSLVIKGKSGMRLGQASSFGYIVSPPISLSGNGTATAITVSFYIAAQNANAVDKGTLTVSVEGTDLVSSGYTVTSSEPASNTSYILSSNDNLKKTWTISDVSSLPDPFQLRFATSVDGRVCIDQIVVMETYSSGLPKLSTPVVLAPSTNYTGFALSWGTVSDATAYEVSVNDVVVTNCGPSETTATVTGLAEGELYNVSVVAKGDGTTHDDSDPATLSVTTLTAPAVTEPVLTPSAVSSSSFTVSWPAQPAADHFSVRAWTLVPADSATEYFVGYAADGTPPEGWNFQNKGTPYGDQAENPVDFRDDGDWIGSPVFGGIVTNVSFRLRRQTESGSTFTVYGSTGSDNESEWKTAENTLAVLTGLQTQVYDIPIDVSKGIKRIFFQYTKSSGNVSIGTFSVKGAGVGKARSYLEGYGSDAAGVTVGGTSVTVSNPVAGETNYVEVTATGFTGRTAASELGVPVPGRPVVISVK